MDARGRASDLGTGSGAIAIAKSPQVETVCAYDISPPALATARVNAEINRAAHKVAICPTRKALLAAAPYDVVTANPPYLPKRRKRQKLVRRPPPRGHKRNHSPGNPRTQAGGYALHHSLNPHRREAGRQNTSPTRPRPKDKSLHINPPRPHMPHRGAHS
ncbi:50S ribosomal protein L11 methyltransferase [Pyrobaculum neutrophilum]|uniref:50S ribosomal protein L11 methyltransferase n=1 Tax=Pyrobaculum neutrophilum TaxID=70771 RepID=UPI001FE0844B|nr:50S ribosomal protein L11 methyltransferase [Pyrobaculum neutrophilum]